MARLKRHLNTKEMPRGVLREERERKRKEVRGAGMLRGGKGVEEQHGQPD